MCSLTAFTMCIVYYFIVCIFYMFSRYKGKLLYFAYFYARNIQYVRLTKNVLKIFILLFSLIFSPFLNVPNVVY